MALRAGYYGLKKKLLEKVNSLPGIKSIGDGLSLNSTTGVLSATGGGGGTTVVANPEGEATADLTKLQVDTDIYGIPAQPDITGKADITAIGTNETGTTASRAYAIGEHFYKNGKFCTATASIALGATFTLNTNYVEGTIAGQLPLYKNYEFNVIASGSQTGNASFDAGIIGTRGAQCTYDLTDMYNAGYIPYAAVVSATANSSAYIPYVMADEDTLYLNLYRATDEAKDCYTIVRVAFVKKN